MKHLTALLFAIITTTAVNAQSKYDYIGQFGEYKSDWALIRLDEKLGFINDKGKVVVKPTYDNIGQFGEYKSDWALVTLNGKNGFINSQGKFIRHRRKQ